MKCRYCNEENLDGAKFCRVCGKPFEERELTIRDRFPEYSFEPTSVTKIKGSPWWMVLVVINCIALLFFLFCTIGNLLYGISHEHSEDMVVGAIMLIPDVIFFVILRKIYSKTKAVDVSSQYDYIQGGKASNLYRFVIKDSKFGVINVKTKKSQIPCEYEYLQWKSVNRILLATRDGSTFEIDILGNRLK